MTSRRVAGRPAAVFSDTAHGDDNDSSHYDDTQSDGQHRLSHV